MIKKRMAALTLSTIMTGCASVNVNHVLTDECLQKSEDHDGKVLSIGFNQDCGEHKRELAVAQIEAQKQQSLATIHATALAQEELIKAEKIKHLWAIFATGITSMDRPNQILNIYQGMQHETPEVRALVNETRASLGISHDEIKEQVEIWNLQAKQGLDIKLLRDGSFYVDTQEAPYGPLAPEQ